MSTMCTVLGVTPAQIHALRAKPALVSKLARVARIDLFKAHSSDELGQFMSPEQRAQFEASQAQFAGRQGQWPHGLDFLTSPGSP